MMIKASNNYQKYKELFQSKGIDFILLNKEDVNVERLANIFIKIDSEYLFPTEEENKLRGYSEKLLLNAYNFILADKNDDIGILSIYANDFNTKTAYTSTLGILPIYRGGKTVSYLVKFGLEFAKEMGMEVYKAEIDKRNSKWLTFLTRYGFRIEKETDNNSYIIVKDL